MKTRHNDPEGHADHERDRQKDERHCNCEQSLRLRARVRELEEQLASLTTADTVPPGDDRPGYIPDDAHWAWVTDGLGRTVGAWVVINGVHVFDPAEPSPWVWWASSGAWIHEESAFPELTPSLTVQCRTLWESRPKGGA